MKGIELSDIIKEKIITTTTRNKNKKNIYELLGTWNMWIKKGSYLPLHTTVGLHRTTVIEIKSHLIYGKDPSTKPPPKYRRLTGDYLEGYEKHISTLK